MRLLEVIVTTIDDAREAVRGGAGRLEIVRALDEEGLTPDLDLVRAIRDLVEVPVRVMVRARNTFDIADPWELDALSVSARAFAACGVDGIVCGWVREGDLDVRAIARVADAASPCRLTVHRALEATDDPLAAMGMLKAIANVDRVLATGGDGAWDVRIAGLRALAAALPAHARLLPGGGVNEEALAHLAAAGFDEAHVGRAARVPADAAGRVSAARVAALVAAFDGTHRTP